MGTLCSREKDDSVEVENQIEYLKLFKKKHDIGQISIVQIDAMSRKYKEKRAKVKEMQKKHADVPEGGEASVGELDAAEQALEEQKQEIRTYYEPIKKKVDALMQKVSNVESLLDPCSSPRKCAPDASGRAKTSAMLDALDAAGYDYSEDF